MESSSSDEENSKLEFWNNWSPLKGFSLFRGNQTKNKVSQKVLFHSSRVQSVKGFEKNSSFSKWIPPLNFVETDSKTLKKIITSVSEKRIQNKKIVHATKGEKIKREVSEISEKKGKYFNATAWKKEVNLNWGKRIVLHDITKFNDGELIWGVVNVGIFGNIKLWVNEYGNVTGLADGKISNFSNLEMSYICITDIELLRKMLNLSNSQWAYLCETVQETKVTLKFNAFQEHNLIKYSQLEKLWFFICKRRHFFPPQSMRVKLCGAIKCIKKFQIISKLVVQDIRGPLGELIL